METLTSAHKTVITIVVGMAIAPDIRNETIMAKHARKSAADIAEEIRRQAQGAARAKGDVVRISSPVIIPTDEPTRAGSHWILAEAPQDGRSYVESAAMRIARIWDLARP